MPSKKKQIQVFMTPNDESSYSAALRKLEADIVFLDGNVWDAEAPVVFESIERCTQGIAYLWNRRLFPSLPTISRSDGRREGPISGVVIQFVRSRVSGDLLLSGRIAAGYDDSNEEYARFIKAVFDTLKSHARKDLTAIDPATNEAIRDHVPEYVVGLDAASRFKEGQLRLFKDRSTDTFFRLKTEE